MRSLPLSAVAKWKQTDGGRWIPTSIDTSCPHCGRMVNLPLRAVTEDGARHTVAASATCPGCRGVSHFWIINPHRKDRACDALCVHPDPHVRQPVVDSATTGNEPLSRTYEAAVAAYNAGLWEACATSCRKTLEGIVHHLNPTGKQGGALFDQLEVLFHEKDLSGPLVRIAKVLRKGGNVAAHFNLEIQTDRATAENLVDLVDYFLEYLFVLPERASLLEQRLVSGAAAQAAPTNGDV